METSITPKELAREIGHTDGGKRIRSFLRSSLIAGHVKHQSWVLSPETADTVRAHFRGERVSGHPYRAGRTTMITASVLEGTDAEEHASPSNPVEPKGSVRNTVRRRCQTEFGIRCAENGLRLEADPQIPGLTNRGHLSTALRDHRTIEILKEIFEALGGDERELGLVPQRMLESDFLHRPSSTLIEVDEIQHFTSYRQVVLELYPDDCRLGFDRDEYLQLIEQHREKADRAFAHKSAKAFGSRGRPRQRAYLDAVRDLALPAIGYSPVVRIAAPEGESGIAFERFRSNGQLDELKEIW